MLVRGTTPRTGSRSSRRRSAWAARSTPTPTWTTPRSPATALSRHWAEMLGARRRRRAATRPSPRPPPAAVKDFLLKQIRNRGDKPYDAGVDFIGRRLFGVAPLRLEPAGHGARASRRSTGTPSSRTVPAVLRAREHGARGERPREGPTRCSPRSRGCFGNMPEGYAPAAPALPSPPAAGGLARRHRGAGRAGPDPDGRVRAARWSHPDFAAVKVLANVLGGGMSGRFFSELRDKQGLAYTTGAHVPGPHRAAAPSWPRSAPAPENAEKSEAGAPRRARARPARAGRSAEELRGGQGLPARQPRDGPAHERAPGLVPGVATRSPGSATSSSISTRRR